MAAKQMEEIHKKLGTKLNYPRADDRAQSLLFAGKERFALLQWLFFKLLGDKSPFSQQNLQAGEMDRDDETSRIQYLADIAKFLGITSAVDTEAIQKSRNLHRVVWLVSMSPQTTAIQIAILGSCISLRKLLGNSYFGYQVVKDWLDFG